MPAVPLGLTPQPLTLTLASDADFIATLLNPTGWPEGTTIQLRLIPLGAAPIVWTATIADTVDDEGHVTVPSGSATFDIHATDVATAINTGVKTVRLHYLDNTGDDLLWGKGPIYVA